MSIHDMKKKLSKVLPKKRYEHTLGVEYTACALAMRYGADMKKARIAGLLHDCAKNLSDEEKFEACSKYAITITECERENPELLHAKIGAAFAKEIYDITDEEILNAISWHTTGCPDMTLLDKIIYIADYMEPNRDKADNLAEVRKLAFEDIDECLYKILKDSVDYLEKKNSVTDPMTQQTYEYYREMLHKA